MISALCVGMEWVNGIWRIGELVCMVVILLGLYEAIYYVLKVFAFQI